MCRKTPQKVASKRNVLSQEQSYTALYKAEDHWGVLTQRAGSLWPRIWPYCLVNTTLMLMTSLCKQHFEDFQISPQGHTFVSVVVAFLLLTRVQTVVSRYNEARHNLAVMYRNTRELIANIAVMSSKSTNEEAKEWRLEVAYRMLLLLRTSMAVIDYPTDFVPAWKINEMQGSELQDILRNTYVNPEHQPMEHEIRSEFEESMRIPIRISYLLKKSFYSQEQRLEHPFHPLERASVMSTIDNFMSGYYGIRLFLTTPIPFPLVQMSRTFLFAYVFTIPFCLLSKQFLVSLLTDYVLALAG